MAKTRSEKLQHYIGRLVLCDGCKNKKILTNNWMMGTDLNLYCPACQKEALNKGVCLISI